MNCVVCENSLTLAQSAGTLPEPLGSIACSIFCQAQILKAMGCVPKRSLEAVHRQFIEDIGGMEPVLDYLNETDAFNGREMVRTDLAIYISELFDA